MLTRQNVCVEISRRKLLGLGLTSSVLLAACSSQGSAAAQSTEDDPRIDLGSTMQPTSTTDAPPVSTAPLSTSAASPSAVPETTAVDSPATAPSTAALGHSLPPGAQSVPKEGDEPYVRLGTIQIPSINIDTPLGDGVTLTNLNRGPGHWPGTALPGEIGNSVIGGHRVSHTHPFRDLDKLAMGDVVTMTVAAGTFSYTVTGTEIVLPTDIQVLDQIAEHTATLFACNPQGQTTQRIIVHLKMSKSPA